MEIYRQGQDVEVLREAELSRRESPTSLSAEDVLPGFVLDLTQILN